MDRRGLVAVFLEFAPLKSALPIKVGAFRSGGSTCDLLPVRLSRHADMHSQSGFKNALRAMRWFCCNFFKVNADL